MAQVTITIEDDDGGINIRCESNPPWPGPAKEDQSLTYAQSVGLDFIEHLKGTQGTPTEMDVTGTVDGVEEEVVKLI